MRTMSCVYDSPQYLFFMCKFTANILTNIKNLFCQLLGVYAEVAEDGFSVKLTSSKFTSKEAINKILN